MKLLYQLSGFLVALTVTLGSFYKLLKQLRKILDLLHAHGKQLQKIENLTTNDIQDSPQKDQSNTDSTR